MTGTTYACNVRNDWDQMYVQSQIYIGLYMLAISFNRNQICFQCRKLFQSHVTMISGRISWKLIFNYCNLIWSFLKTIAIIFGPCYIIFCNHIWSSPIQARALSSPFELWFLDSWSYSLKHAFFEIAFEPLNGVYPFWLIVFEVMIQ